MDTRSAERESVLDAFRRWGYLEADLDPVGYLRPQPQAELELSGETAAYARRVYCGKIGVELMHIQQPEQRRWVAERLEAEVVAPDRPHIMMRLIEAGVFEQVLQSRYPWHQAVFTRRRHCAAAVAGRSLGHGGAVGC